MIRVYIAAGILGAVLFAYVAGVARGRVGCERDVVRSGADAGAQIIQQIGEVNEKVLDTGVHDIRRVLRAQYTIAE